MVAPRRARNILGDYPYSTMVTNIDWNRVIIEAEGRHFRAAREGDHPSPSIGATLCGACIREVLLSKDPMF